MTKITDKFTGVSMVGDFVSKNETHSTFKIVKGRKVMMGKTISFLNSRTEYKNIY